MKRKQFTFYESFYKAMEKIKSKTARADIFDALCGYALYGREPDLDAIRPEAAMMFEMAKPVLDAAQKKADGASGRNRCKMEEGSGKDDTKIVQRYEQVKGKEKEVEIEKELELEIEVEKELEKELERESERADAGAREREHFDIFWKEFPKKVDKNRAWVVFQGVDVPLQVLLDALAVQKKSEQWLEDGGRFIPRAAAWLRERRWEDEVVLPKAPTGASGVLGEAELAAIAQMMAEE